MNYKAITIAGGILTGIGLCMALFWTNYTKFIMGISQKGLDLIKQHEGCRLTAYLCPAKVLTIGYGHTGSDVKAGMTITQAQAEQLLKDDVKRFEIGVSALTAGITLTQNQYDALVSFAFNVGLSAFTTSTLLKKLRVNPKDPSIADEFAKWRNGGGQILPGLVARRQQEANLYFA